MDDNKAIEILKNNVPKTCKIVDGRYQGGFDDWKSDMGQAIETATAALKKQMPMKVKEVHVDEYYCPACGAENGCNDGTVEDKFCPECGQALCR